MHFQLIIENGKAKGVRVDLPENAEVVIGRDPKAGLRLPDVMVSRQHFVVVNGPDGCFVRDLSSQNGTFVNDMRVDGEAPLQPGDMIHAGETTLSILEKEGKGLVSKEIAGYRIIERVGRGGMGTVYRANQLSLNREVAFKVLSARLIEDETFVDLFVKEARAAGALNHPNIVQVYDVGRKQGLYYFSMEFMSRGSVQDLINREGSLPWPTAVQIVLDAVRGLEYAQRKGVVHRDIKPDNLMLAEDGTAKIADLGLAHRSDDTAAAGGEGILGTPHFIAPEQAQGKPVDVRSDLYSLGATFYRMVTGRNPFTGRNVRDIVLAQIRETAPPVHEVDPAIPRELGAIIQRMMEKEPDDRYQMPAELIEELERIWERADGSRAANPLKKLLIGAGLGVAALIVLFVLFSGNDPEPAPQPDETDITATNGSTAPVSPAVVGPGPAATPDPAAVRNAREAEAKAAYFMAKSESKLGDTQRLERLRAIARKHGATEYGRLAAGEADKLQGVIQFRAEQIKKKKVALNKAWAEAAGRADALEGELRYAEAARVLQAFLDTGPKVANLDLTATARKRRAAVAADARREYQTLEEQAGKLAAASRFDEAVAVLTPFADHAAACDSPDPAFTRLANQAAARIKAHRLAAAELVTRRFLTDRKRLIASYHAARRLASEYDFAAALEVLDKAHADAGTASYRDRIARVREPFRAMAALKTAFIERAGRRGGIKNTRVPLDTSMVRQDHGVLKGADAESLHVEVSIKGSRSTFKRPWSGYPASKLLLLFTEDRWALSADELRAVAHLATFLGDYSIALEFAAGAADANLAEAINREREAATTYLEAIRFQQSAAWSEVLARTRRLRHDFADTLLYLRHTSGETPLAAETPGALNGEGAAAGDQSQRGETPAGK